MLSLVNEVHIILIRYSQAFVKIENITFILLFF